MSRGLAFLLLLASSTAVAIPASEVAPPRVGWVQDLTGTLRPEVIREITELGDEVSRAGVGQLGVAIVDSTDGASPRSYATQLFNRWGVGQADWNDGVLLFVAIEDRKAEIILGTGIDSDASVRQTDEIMSSIVVANFKRGDPNAAVLEASRALAAFLRSGPTAHDPSGTGATPVPYESQSEREYVSPVSSASDDFLPMGAGVGLVGLAGGGFALRRYLRRRPRKCKRCGQPRLLLDEVGDDQHLDEGQRSEERFKSVDYDVWYCVPCEDTLVLRYGRWFSGRTSCAKCRYKTALSKSQTLVAATYDHGGVVKVTETCGHCNHVRSFKRSTPRRQRSSSSSGGSSFGGGSSSGRGSSGSW